MSFDQLTSALNALGEIVSTEPDVLEKHACDWSNVNRQRPLAVLRPRSVAEVSAAQPARPPRESTERLKRSEATWVFMRCADVAPRRH